MHRDKHTSANMTATSVTDASDASLADLPLLLHDIARAYRKRCDRELRTRIPQMTSMRAALLARLESGPSACQAQLARSLGVTQMTLVRLLDGAERLGWVMRQRVVGDRRAWTVCLTTAGRQCLTAVHSSQSVVLNQLGTGFEAARWTKLIGVLNELRQKLA